MVIPLPIFLAECPVWILPIALCNKPGRPLCKPSKSLKQIPSGVLRLSQLLSAWLTQRKVVYGDTDSMFVLLKGASKDDAFRIGKEISQHITKINPDPVKLKFEKARYDEYMNLIVRVGLFALCPADKEAVRRL